MRKAHPTLVGCKVEDAPCYFNFRPKENQPRQKDESKLQDVLLKHPRWHQCFLGSGCATIFLLMGAIIALSVWVWQTKEYLDARENPKPFQEFNCSHGCDSGTQQISQDDLQTLLQFLCKLHDNNSPENSRCKLCPENWLRHENKCYWISKERQTWNHSQNDCAAKVSHLAVIQKQEELDFIQRVTDGAQLLWIGLIAAPHKHEWSWVDSSLLNNTLLQVTEAPQGNTCGMLKGNKVISDACTAVTKWICEKDAFLVEMCNNRSCKKHKV